MVEARPPGGFGVKGSVGIEVAADNRKTESLDELESHSQVVLQLESVVVVARNNTCCCQDEPVGVGDRQHVGGFGFLPTLICHRLAPFLDGRVTAVEVQMVGVDLVTDAQNAVLQHPL